MLNGFIIPSLVTRRVDTIVKLWPGQSYLIAGLFLDELTETNDNLFGLDKVPLIGPLFSSKHGEDAKTELIIVVTPYLVDNEQVCDSSNPGYCE
jgi:pilus assembly protein CpaC